MKWLNGSRVHDKTSVKYILSVVVNQQENRNEQATIGIGWTAATRYMFGKGLILSRKRKA